MNATINRKELQAACETEAAFFFAAYQAALDGAVDYNTADYTHDSVCEGLLEFASYFQHLADKLADYDYLTTGGFLRLRREFFAVERSQWQTGYDSLYALLTAPAGQA